MRSRAAAAVALAAIVIGAEADFASAAQRRPVARFTLSATRIAIGAAVTVDTRRSSIPRGTRFARATISWGDGTRSTKLSRLHQRVRHVYTAPGRRTIRLSITTRNRRKASRIATLTVERPRAVLAVGTGLDLLDLDARGAPYPGRGIAHPALSRDGRHVTWVYLAGEHDYGLVWRDLAAPRTLELPGVYPYALDMSGDGRYVAYAAASKIASNGHVDGMTVWLWDTATGRRTAINRAPSGQVADDGSTSGLRVSADGRFVVFDSTAPSLAPAGVTVCAQCIEGGGYVYRYDRLTGALASVPPAPFGSDASLRYPVTSGDGRVVLFHHGLATYAWFPESGAVRKIDALDALGETNDDSLAVSDDGTTAANHVYGLTVVKLGGPEGPDPVAWSRPEESPAYVASTALSADGSALAYFGLSGPAAWGQWPVWRVDVPSGALTLLPAPPTVAGLTPEPAPRGGMGANRVTISADGRAIVAAACSLGPPASAEEQSCPLRADVFRWSR